MSQGVKPAGNDRILLTINAKDLAARRQELIDRGCEILSVTPPYTIMTRQGRERRVTIVYRQVLLEGGEGSGTSTIHSQLED